MRSALTQLEPVGARDASIIFEAWGQYAENFQYLTARAFCDVIDAQNYLDAILSNPHSFAHHIVTTEGQVVGIIKVVVTEHRAQVGYVIHRAFAGRGFGTEALRSVSRLLEATPTISRIWATCALENHASIRVLEKCGFVREGILRNWVLYPAQGNRPFDNYSYVKLPEQTG